MAEEQKTIKIVRQELGASEVELRRLVNQAEKGEVKQAKEKAAELIKTLDEVNASLYLVSPDELVASELQNKINLLNAIKDDLESILIPHEDEVLGLDEDEEDGSADKEGEVSGEGKKVDVSRVEEVEEVDEDELRLEEGEELPRPEAPVSEPITANAPSTVTPDVAHVGATLVEAALAGSPAEIVSAPASLAPATAAPDTVSPAPPANAEPAPPAASTPAAPAPDARRPIVSEPPFIEPARSVPSAAETIPSEGAVEADAPPPERRPIYMPCEFLIELIGSDKLKNIMGMFALEQDEAQIKSVLAEVFDTDLEQTQTDRAARGLGFSLTEEFKKQWKNGMHQRVFAGLKDVLKYQIEQAIISDPELQKLEQHGTTKQRILRGIWNAIPAAGAGAAVAAGLFTAGVGSVVAIGAAGAAAKMVGRFFRKGNKRVEAERRVENAPAINRLHANVSQRVKEQMLNRAAADGDLTMAAAISTVLREPTEDQTETDEMRQLRRQSEMTQLIATVALERARVSGAEQDKETATNKQLDSLVAEMRLKNEKVRQENTVPALIERQSFWTKIMEEVKKAGSARDLWLHDEKFWKQAAGFAVEGAAGFAAGAAIGLAGGSLALRGLARGAVGLTSGAGEQALRDKSREMARTDKLNEFLGQLRDENEEVAMALRKRLNQILPPELSGKEKWLSALKGGAKRAAWVVGLGALFDVGRGVVEDYIKTADKARFNDLKEGALKNRGSLFKAGLEYQDFKQNFSYLTVGENEGLSHAATRDFLYNEKVRAAYMANVHGLEELDIDRLNRIAAALKTNNGDFATLEKSQNLSSGDMKFLRSTAKTISEHNGFSRGNEELRVNRADKLMTVFDQASGRHKIVALDDSGRPTSQVDWAQELYGATVKQEQITLADGIPVTVDGTEATALPEASMVNSVTTIDDGKTYTVTLKNGQGVEGLILNQTRNCLIASDGTKLTGGGGSSVAEVVVGSKEVVTSKSITTDDVPAKAKFDSDVVMEVAMRSYGDVEIKEQIKQALRIPPINNKAVKFMNEIEVKLSIDKAFTNQEIKDIAVLLAERKNEEIHLAHREGSHTIKWFDNEGIARFYYDKELEFTPHSSGTGVLATRIDGSAFQARIELKSGGSYELVEIEPVAASAS